VDQTHLETARGYLAQLANDAAGDEPAASNSRRTAASKRSTDDAWAQIVAGFHDEPADRSWPDAEDLDDRPTGPRIDGEPGAGETGPTTGTTRTGGLGLTDERPAPSTPRSDPRSDPYGPSLLDGLDTFGASLPDDDEEEGYVPPVPPPIPRPSVPTVLGVAGILLGMVVFLSPGLLPMPQDLVMLIGLTAVASGFGTLVWRLRPGGDDDDEDPDPDNGARV
jgi:hypothetical protein